MNRLRQHAALIGGTPVLGWCDGASARQVVTTDLSQQPVDAGRQSHDNLERPQLAPAWALSR